MQNKRPLYIYVVAVAAIWAIILGLMWYLGHYESLHKFILVASGFALGMLAMYIAVHLYRWK